VTAKTDSVDFRQLCSGAVGGILNCGGSGYISGWPCACSVYNQLDRRAGNSRMMICVIDAAVAVCFPVALIAMRFGNIYSLNVMGVAAELGGDGSAAIDGGGVAAEAATLAAP